MNRIFLLFLLLPIFVQAQDEPFFFKDYNYNSNIKSVKFHPIGADLAFPLIYLNTPDYLVLGFDDMDADDKDYMYKVIQCNQDWTPSGLTYFDYIEGLEEQNIRDFDFSFGTISQYTHFHLEFPNEDMGVTKSGNYLLVVYEDYEDNPIITRRFVVADPVVQVFAKMTMPSSPSKFQTHQEFDFSVDYKGLGVRNPMTTISATVVQNSRWNTALSKIPPFLINRNEQLSFDYQNKIVFPGGKEWRYAPLRSIEYAPTNDVVATNRYEDGWYMKMRNDVLLGELPYLNLIDLNGSFVIGNRDERQRDSSTNSEYINTLFTLSTNLPYTNQDVYLFGELTNWEIKPEFKCVYNEATNGYISRQLLKQGYYNYAYALYDPKTKKIDFTETEGNWRLTENEYSIIIYHRAFGEQYDSVIGAYRFKTIEPNVNLFDLD